MFLLWRKSQHKCLFEEDEERKQENARQIYRHANGNNHQEETHQRKCKEEERRWIKNM